MAGLFILSEAVFCNFMTETGILRSNFQTLENIYKGKDGQQTVISHKIMDVGSVIVQKALTYMKILI